MIESNLPSKLVRYCVAHDSSAEAIIGSLTCESANEGADGVCLVETFLLLPIERPLITELEQANA